MPENAMDYYGADGLLYCGKCHTPKDAFFAKGLVLMGKNRHPVECSCHKAEREQQEAAIKERKHLDLVRRLKADGFSDSAMLNWTFANDNGRSPQMHHAHRYVEQWQTMHAENLGLLLWGSVGTGKSFLAGCIHQEKITADNIYHLLLAFDEVYNAATEVEQKEFMRAFIERIDIFPEKQPNGNWIRNIVFAFPVPYNGKEIREFPLESQSTVEVVSCYTKTM